MSLFNNIFSGNATKEETKQQKTNVAVSEKSDNREKILEFKEAIKNAVEEQKGIKKITRAPHTNYSLVWPKQSAEIENRQWLFKAYTAYYIVKHYLWTDKDRMNEYIEKVISDAKRALKGSDDWSDKWLKNKFREGVEDLVNAYIPVELEPRLYVLVSEDLRPVYGCVQGGHAVAQWVIDNQWNNRVGKWNNNYLIFLYANLDKWTEILRNNGISYSHWCEPDLDGKMTAIAVESDGELFKGLKTVK